MNLALPDASGYAAAFLTACSFVPQAWLSFRTKDVRGISLGMYGVFTPGVAPWLVCGLLLAAWPIVLGKGITLMLAAAILLMKIRHGGEPGPAGSP